jgi:membrane associated rhomboid family serine protease
VFVPIRDINPLKKIQFQHVTIALIAVNVLVFFLFQFQDLMQLDACHAMGFAKSYGIIPVELRGVDVALPAECLTIGNQVFQIPEPLTLVSYAFLHGDVWHLVGNMLFLWVFGDNVEDAMGHVRFLMFYILCGIAAGLTHFALNAQSAVPLIGASGAVAGVVAAYLMLHPRVNLWVLVFRVIPLQVRAVWALGAWILMNVFFALVPSEPLVAWWAHIGGMIAGAILIVLMRRRGVALFDQHPVGG